MNTLRYFGASGAGGSTPTSAAVGGPSTQCRSQAVSVATLVAMLAIFVLLPPDHFLHTRPTGSVAWRLIRSALGVLLVVAGVALLVLPGPGIIALVLGLSLTDFPGKRWFERRVLCRKRVLAPINGLRRRLGRRPLLAPCAGGETDRTDSGAERAPAPAVARP